MLIVCIFDRVDFRPFYLPVLQCSAGPVLMFVCTSLRKWDILVQSRGSAGAPRFGWIEWIFPISAAINLQREDVLRRLQPTMILHKQPLSEQERDSLSIRYAYFAPCVWPFNQKACFFCSWSISAMTQSAVGVCYWLYKTKRSDESLVRPFVALVAQPWPAVLCPSVSNNWLVT